MPNKDIFIKEAKKTHGDKYDYSLVDYKNNYTKVDIKCNNCGEIFSQEPNKHVKDKHVILEKNIDLQIPKI